MGAGKDAHRDDDLLNADDGPPALFRGFLLVEGVFARRMKNLNSEKERSRQGLKMDGADQQQKHRQEEDEEEDEECDDDGEGRDEDDKSMDDGQRRKERDMGDEACHSG